MCGGEDEAFAVFVDVNVLGEDERARLWEKVEVEDERHVIRLDAIRSDVMRLQDADGVEVLGAAQAFVSLDGTWVEAFGGGGSISLTRRTESSIGEEVPASEVQSGSPARRSSVP